MLPIVHGTDMGADMVYYNDNNDKCCQVLRKNIGLGNLPEGVIDGRDIREISGEELRKYRHIHLFSGIGGFPLGLKWAGWPENLSIVTGGFPCQPHSLAGKRGGKADDRYLWPEMLRIIREVNPRWVFVENVFGILSSDNGLVIEEVLSSLEDEGYETIPSFIIPACAVDAWHRRDRVWIIAYSRLFGQKKYEKQTARVKQLCKIIPDTESKQDRRIFREQFFSDIGTESKNMADSNSEGLPQSKQRRIVSGSITQCRWWESEPGVGRMATRVPGRVDRLKQLGNSVVPQVVEMIGRAILAAEQSIMAS